MLQTITAMSKLASVLLSGRTYTCICTQAFFVFKEQDARLIVITLFIVIRINVILPGKIYSIVVEKR